MNYKLIVIGKLKERYLKLAADEYKKRLRSYCRLEFIELRESKLAYREAARTREAELIQSKLSKNYRNIALSIEGQQMSSLESAKFLRDIQFSTKPNINFIIGGSFGLSPKLQAQMDFNWSFSRLTFPHQLFRIIFLEQLYRTMKINSNEQYHK